MVNVSGEIDILTLVQNVCTSPVSAASNRNTFYKKYLKDKTMEGIFRLKNTNVPSALRCKSFFVHPLEGILLIATVEYNIWDAVVVKRAISFYEWEHDWGHSGFGCH
ncbi:hypothetical protein JTE90_029568 [Oedothorax gibbosus]|uniref:Uncharacterized protein n=1 Tax=Oedothorax gibbosus TaxID=931172 RepID=A0AAV6VBU5_9ARAC|nr:hypothetical protein JTE90_029568 [Oedothorax gibbosus]